MKLQILLPVYNCAPFLASCLESLLNQSYSDFELLILDDCSTDDSRKIIRAYEKKDSRISVFINESNMGIIYCRNKLIELADAEYIAITDADDIYLSNKLELQISYLESNSEVAAVSCGYKRIGHGEGCFIPPEESKLIAAYLTLINVFPNPGVVARRQILLENKICCDPNYKGAADFKMWQQLSYSKLLANLPIVLFHYRVHQLQESTQNIVRQRHNHLRLVQAFIDKMQIELSISELLLSKLIWPSVDVKPDELNNIGKFVKYAIDKFSSADVLYKKELIFVWELRFKSLCRLNGLRGYASYIKFFGIKKLIKGKCLGISFFWACFTQQLGISK